MEFASTLALAAPFMPERQHTDILVARLMPTAGFLGSAQRSLTTSKPRSPDQSWPLGRFYGRRRGRPLRPGRSRLMAESLPELRLPVMEDCGEALPLTQLFPLETKELWLEIGFGARRGSSAEFAGFVLLLGLGRR